MRFSLSPPGKFLLPSSRSVDLLIQRASRDRGECQCEAVGLFLQIIENRGEAQAGQMPGKQDLGSRPGVRVRPRERQSRMRTRGQCGRVRKLPQSRACGGGPGGCEP